MTPELLSYVLSLPLNVRVELGKCDGPYWLAARYATHTAHLLCKESGSTSENEVYLPISPIAIALHAATLGNYDTAQVRISRRTGKSWAWVTVDPDPSAEWLGDRWNEADAEDDPTGHRAAIALLQKVMAEKVTL